MKLDKVRVEYQFEDLKMRELVGWGFQALQKMPTWVRCLLSERDHMNDMANEVYLAAISYAKMTKEQQNSFASEIRDPQKRRYKGFVRYVGQELYQAIRILIPEFKRKYYTKFMDPGRLKGVQSPEGQGVPYSREQDLLSVDQEV